MGKSLRSKEDINLSNLQSIQEVVDIDVGYFKKKSISVITAKILVILKRYEKLAGICRLSDLRFTIRDSKQNLNDLYLDETPYCLSDVLKFLREGLLNPRLNITTHKELILLAKEIGYTIALDTNEHLTNFIECYNIQQLKAPLFELIESSQIEFSKSECVDILTNHFYNLNNNLVWSAIAEERCHNNGSIRG